MMKLMFVLVLVLVANVRAQATQASSADLMFGSGGLSGWSGVAAESSVAALAVPGVADYRYPTGPRGFYKHGFRMEDDSTKDWTGLWGVRFEANPSDARELELTIFLDTARANAPDKQVLAIVRLTGAGWHSVNLPWSAFG